MLMAEFLTAIQHRLPVKIIISNDNALGQILWEQMVLGYPEHGVRYPEPFADYAAFATANGALGVKVGKPGEVKNAIRLALSHPGPALVDANVNPAEPPLPGKVEYEQAKNFALAFLRGQPKRATIATTVLKDRIQAAPLVINSTSVIPNVPGLLPAADPLLSAGRTGVLAPRHPPLDPGSEGRFSS